jgi:hypothetical protein
MTQAAAIEALNNAILDLQQADYNTYERPVKKWLWHLTIQN